MTTHTPGPWRVTSHDDDSNYEIGGNSGRVFRFNIRHGLIPMLEDARLICAAPDMLVALNQVIAAIAASPHSRSDETLAALATARAAIAKATGGAA